MTFRVAGVDGAAGSWLMATWIDGAVRTRLLPAFDDVVACTDALELDVVGVDMPIGLPANDPRASDTEARALLGARRSTLFPTPVAAVLDAVDYDDACRLSRAASGRALSKQMFNLLPMVRQVRAAVDPVQVGRFVEVHPESSFVQLVGHPLAPKKTAEGVGQRLAALASVFPAPHDVLAAAPPGSAVDDVVDAMAIAWSAHRFQRGEAKVFGSGVDSSGYSLCIVA